MAIDNLFNKQEQIDILWSVRRINRQYDVEGVSRNRRFYFRQLADKYEIVQRLKSQIDAYKSQALTQEELTTNPEIANLFCVRTSTVEAYLSLKIRNGDKAERGKLCLEQGQTNGWEYLKNSGQLHTLTAIDLAKPKQYHGRKKRNNKSPRTS